MRFGFHSSVAAALVVALSATGCYTSSTHTASVSTPAGGLENPGDYAGRTGQVVNVRETVQRTQGQPVAGAAAGALIGGVLFGAMGAHPLAGAAVGGVAGGVMSSGASQRRTFEVTVQFDDGTRGVFNYADYTPLRPGERVVMTQNGPMPMNGGPGAGPDFDYGNETY